MIENKMRNKKMVDLYKQGYSSCEIAAIFSLSHQRICQILNREKVEIRSAQYFGCDKCGCPVIIGRNARKVKRGLFCFDCLKKEKEKWCYKLNLDNCVVCGRNDRPYQAKGMCSVCYSRDRYYSYKTKHLESVRKWAKNNPERIKKIQKKASHNYYLKNKERLLEYERQYYKKNKTRNKLSQTTEQEK